METVPIDSTQKYHALHDPSPPSRSGKFFYYFTSRKKPVQIQSARTGCCQKVTSCVKRVVNFIHNPASSLALSAISLTGSIVTTFYPQNTIYALSNIAFAYFGQTFASHASDRATSGVAKKASKYTSRVVQHSSLASMMAVGFFRQKPWATPLSYLLAGFSLRLKVSHDSITDDKLPQQVIQVLKRDTGKASESCAKKVILIAGCAFSTLLSALGVALMLSFQEATGARSLTLSVACAEFGLQTLGGLCGYIFHRALLKNEYALTSRALSKIDSIAIGLCIFGHTKLPTNIKALGVIFPLGFFLGMGISKMQRLNAIENTLLADHTSESPQERRCSTIFWHVVGTALFEAAGLYFILNPDDETVGYDVFFTLTPLIYYITRYGFSKKSKDDSGIGHFFFHKSPQLMSAGLNYGLSFVAVKAVEKTDANARIFFIFQALLFGSTQGALFTIDEKEDALEALDVPQDIEQKTTNLQEIVIASTLLSIDEKKDALQPLVVPQSIEQDASKPLLVDIIAAAQDPLVLANEQERALEAADVPQDIERKTPKLLQANIRKVNTSNYARMDILIPALVNNLSK